MAGARRSSPKRSPASLVRLASPARAALQPRQGQAAKLARMRTAIVSDLHLGSATGEDVAARPGDPARCCWRRSRAPTGSSCSATWSSCASCRSATRSSAARPFFEELGEALGDREVVLVPGNHDHRLAEPLLDELSIAGDRRSGSSTASPPPPARRPDRRLARRGRAAARLPGHLAARRRLRHPRPLHGLPPVPAPRRVRRRGGADALAPAAQTRRRRPTTSGSCARSMASPSGSPSRGLRGRARSRPSERAWSSLAGATANGAGALAASRLAPLRAGLPGRRSGRSTACSTPTSTADLSPAAILRSGVAAASEMAGRLGVDAAHVITGHTHRGGPGEGEAEWPLPGGGRLHNTGSWVFATAFHHPGTPPSPYWPGTVTWVEDEGAPRRVQLLRPSTRTRRWPEIVRSPAAARRSARR